MKRWCLVAACALSGGCGGQADSQPAHPGQEVYLTFCFSCHAAGVAGAPRMGDAEDWAPRIAKGRDALLESTIEGIPPGMPPRGLCSDCSDQELADAIGYMIRQSQ